jgi:hypothetical protein
MNKLVLVGIVAILLVGCTAPQPAASQVTAVAVQPAPQSAPQPAPQSASVAQPIAAMTPNTTRTRTAQAASTLATLPTNAPTATASPLPTATATATATAVPTATVTTAAAAKSQIASATNGQASGVLLSLNAAKYSAPALLSPDNNATYNVSQPVAHLAWSATSTDLLTFGQTAACVSDATHFRRAFESYRLVIHSLDASQPDIVQWTENNPSFDLNLTTAPQGRYTWSVDVVTLCESYVVGQRGSTITRSLVGAASPASATRSINWIP